MFDLNSLELPDIPFVSREESLAIELNEFKNGKSAYDLMKNAGQAIAQFIENMEEQGDILIISGGGNNGGDGIVAAENLSSKFKKSLLLIKEPSTPTSKKAFNDLTKEKLEIIHFEDLDKVRELIESHDIIIDAIFGVGIQSEVRSPYDKIIELYSDFEDTKKIISVDLPSGLDCNSGKWHGPEFKPFAVITMMNIKKGLLKLDNTTIKCVDIGFTTESQYVVDEGHLKHLWQRRDPTSHKGQNGRVMVIGGSDEFTGAPVLSGRAVLRSGVDTLRIAVPETIRNIVAGYNEDFIVVKVNGDRHTSKGFKKFRDLTTNRHDVVAIGMGLSNHPNSVKFARQILSHIKNKVKVVLDADAIRAFKDNLDELRDSRVIITPHRAELRMMLGEKVPKDFQQLIQFLMQRAKDLGIIILFKGKTDIITDGTRILFNKTGHAGMTVGGTGDVLAGVVAAANCFVEDRFFATAIAAYIMGLAGEKAAVKYGNSLLASDCIKEIPNVLLDHKK